MKSNVLFILGIILINLFVFTSCDVHDERTDETSPRFVSAKVENDARNEVIVTFNKPLYSSSDGFTITVDGDEVEIVDIEGSGTSRLTFILNNDILYDQVVTIEYNSSEGDAEDEDGRDLRSFSKKEVDIFIEKMDLMVLLPTIPPEMKDETAWLVLRTDEDEDVWAWDHKTANVNESLSAIPTKTPFDLIVYITSDISWRAHMPFSNGYYATMLNLTHDNYQVKVISWISADNILGTNMGQLISINSGLENTTFENAYTLLTNGTDYLESSINYNESLWYKFYAFADTIYTIYINDYYVDEENFSGGVEAIIMDRYKIEFENIPSVISERPQTFIIDSSNKDPDYEGENIYLKVVITDRGGKPGSYQVQVIGN